MALADDDLRRYNREGLIPGPHEDEEAFLQRVAHCLSLHEKIETLTHYMRIAGNMATDAFTKYEDYFTFTK